MTTYESLIVKADQLLKLCADEGTRIVTAESCTGGLIASCLTEIPGSSARFDRGFITYSNEAKMEMLSVKAQDLEEHGAVSEAVAIAMAEGALASSGASLAIAVTGIAGPDGGSDEKTGGAGPFCLCAGIGACPP